jgi:hypothetical protein
LIEALAAALLLGGINTLADSPAPSRGSQPVPFICSHESSWSVTASEGSSACAKQLLIGAATGLIIGAAAATVFTLLAPAPGRGTLALAWALFWIGFSLMDALFRRGSPVVALLQGVLAAAFFGGLFYTLTNAWVESSFHDPDVLRGFAMWAGAFFPGFFVLFWQRS